MSDVVLYKYSRPDGGVTVTPMLSGDDYYETGHRLIADNEMVLTNGRVSVFVIDTDDPSEWSEITYVAPDSDEDIM